MAPRSAIPALLVALSAIGPALAFPIASTSNSFCQSCTWGLGDHSAISCSCNTQPAGQYDLVHFFSSPSYGGFEYKGYGQSSTCYDFNYAQWNGQIGTVESLTLGKDASSCLLYPQSECEGNPIEVDSNRVSSGSKIVASFQCFSSDDYGYGGYGNGPPESTTTLYSTVAVSLPVTIQSTNTEDGAAITPVHTSSAPSYTFQATSSSALSNAESDGAFGTLSTPTTTFPKSVFTPASTLSRPSYPPYGSIVSSSSFANSGSDGANVTPTLPPLSLSLPVTLTVSPLPYGSFPPNPLSFASESDGIIITPASSLPSLVPTVSQTVSLYNPAASNSFASSNSDGIIVTPIPTLPGPVQFSLTSASIATPSLASYGSLLVISSANSESSGIFGTSSIPSTPFLTASYPSTIPVSSLPPLTSSESGGVVVNPSSILTSSSYANYPAVSSIAFLGPPAAPSVYTPISAPISSAESGGFLTSLPTTSTPIESLPTIPSQSASYPTTAPVASVYIYSSFPISASSAQSDGILTSLSTTSSSYNSAPPIYSNAPVSAPVSSAQSDGALTSLSATSTPITNIPSIPFPSASYPSITPTASLGPPYTSSLVPVSSAQSDGVLTSLPTTSKCLSVSGSIYPPPVSSAQSDGLLTSLPAVPLSTQTSGLSLSSGYNGQSSVQSLTPYPPAVPTYGGYDFGSAWE